MPRSRRERDKADLPGITGRVIIDSYRGQLRARAWPKPHGPATSPKLLRSQDAFKQCCELIKRVPSTQIDAAIQTARGTGLYPRDLLMAAMRAGVVDIVTAEGELIINKQYYLEEVMFQGARLQRTGSLGIAATTETVITWQQSPILTVPIWPAPTPTRLEVPTNVNMVRLQGGVRSTANVAGIRQVLFRNQAGVLVATQSADSTGRLNFQCDSGPIPVAPGNWFDMRVFLGAAGTLEAASSTFFSMEILNTTP